MAISLKTVLDGDKGQTELSILLQRARDSILFDIEKKKTHIKLSKLRRKLNKIFYPKKSTKFSSDYYKQLHQKATEEEIIKVFENFNFETNTSGYHSASSSIAPSTLGNAIEKAKKTLEVLLKKIESLDSATSKDKLNDLVE